jgi:hypothetical protein
MGLGPILATFAPAVFACGYVAIWLVLVIRARREDLPRIAEALARTDLHSSEADKDKDKNEKM